MYEKSLKYINMGFTGMFSVETVLKIIGFGVKVGSSLLVFWDRWDLVKLFSILIILLTAILNNMIPFDGFVEFLQGPLEHIRSNHRSGQHCGCPVDGIRGNYQLLVTTRLRAYILLLCSISVPLCKTRNNVILNLISNVSSFIILPRYKFTLKL